jgi:putative inorganic carbon (HCO3(-)) transporter
MPLITIFLIGLFLIIFLAVARKDFPRLVLPFTWTAAIISLWGLSQVMTGESPRAFASLGHANFLGAFLVMILPMTVAMFFDRRGWQRIFYCCSATFQLLALLLTYSRSAWIATIFSFTFLFFIAPKKEKKNTKNTVRSLGAQITVIIVFVGILFLANTFSEHNSKGYSSFSGDTHAQGSPLQKRFQNLFNVESGSGAIRVAIWKDVWEVIQAYPVFGVGPDQLLSVYPHYYRDDPQRPAYAREMIADRAHNEFLDTWISWGVGGMVLWTILLFGSIFYGWRRLHSVPEKKFYAAIIAGVIGYVIMNQTSFSVTITSILAWVLVAGIIKMGETRETVIERSLDRMEIFVAKGIGIVAMLWISIFPVWASHRAVSYFTSSQLTPALEKDLLMAKALAPHESFYPYLLASVYYSVGQGEKDKVVKEQFFSDAVNQLFDARKKGMDPLTTDESLSQVYRAWAAIDPVHFREVEELENRLQVLAPNFKLR